MLSFNILHGKTTNGSFDLDIIANVIKKADADFVSLQEVDFKTNRAKKYDLPTELGYRTKMASIFGRAMYYDGGEYGEGVLSKYSFLSTRNVALPYTKGNEPRAALEITTVLKSGDTISFIGTHLDHLKEDTDRVSQATAINKVFSDNNYPTILTGDLNDTPNSRTINILESFWKASYNKSNPLLTFPSDKPIKKILTAADFDFFNIRLMLEKELSNIDTIWMAIDTYDANLGESILPSGTTITNKAEFALRITNYSAELFVTQAFDLFGVWHGVS